MAKQQAPASANNNQTRRILYFDHKNIAVLQRFVNQFGQIENRASFGLQSRQADS